MFLLVSAVCLGRSTAEECTPAESELGKTEPVLKCSREAGYDFAKTTSCLAEHNIAISEQCMKCFTDVMQEFEKCKKACAGDDKECHNKCISHTMPAARRCEPSKEAAANVLQVDSSIAGKSATIAGSGLFILLAFFN